MQLKNTIEDLCVNYDKLKEKNKFLNSEIDRLNAIIEELIQENS